ncbi:PREDICTED: anoctamin-like protein At1g73020 [Tarenaya hassleriana]|uniref:anoctamin-like protein At1g73020 n=1 Tax=Tarenaya hassleriana TaxID=28532 RepID=UPI00053C1F38|nr:PREDICTED: anoctamin-like protein At1g73020 [Tarenaya hassleriana]XP_010540072.1 PREDICTED: anoctamin-like protein At1g73020 [Tarenaya hassleriana]
MNGSNGEDLVHEIAMVVPKRVQREGGGEEEEGGNCVEVLVDELNKRGLAIDRVVGLTDEFLKVAAPRETLGSAAAELQIRKPTRVGIDLPFEMDGAEAFLTQPDGSLFSWFERFRCYQHLIYGIVNNCSSDITLRLSGREFRWAVGESLVRRLESEGVIKQVFPLHDELKRKELLRTWAFDWLDFTHQPIDQIYSYFGAKIGVYFSFLGMYTRWMIFPAVVGFIVQMVDFGYLQFLVLPIFFISIILWAALLLQFWKRKNAALLARWHINHTIGPSQGYKFLGMEWSSLPCPKELIKKLGNEKTREKEAYQRYEWFAYFKRFRNDVIVILSIICLQLPFELAYAHLYEVITSDILKFVLTVIYLLIIEYFNRFGGKISVKLINREINENAEYRANSLIYKVFGLYFMQTYIGIFYHVLLHRNFKTLRQVLIQRLIISQVFWTLMDGSLPYLKYSYRKYRVRKKKKKETGSSMGKIQFNSRVEKEYLKPAYSASIGAELEDGLFDDFLELALQFGMIMMFACAFPLAFVIATVNNVMGIRTKALKLLVTLRRPVPRAAATIGAWLNICQFLIVMSICTNSALLVCLYDREGKWKIEPGLAAILLIEHILLLLKFGLSRLVPEEPAWVRASRVKNVTQAQDMYSKQLLRTISGEISSVKKKSE